LCPTLGGGGKISFNSFGNEIVIGSGLRPEIGFVPDTWRRRKDIV
jgi:hypothetical protein